MSAANLPALVVYAADGQNVSFGRGTLPQVTVTMRHVADAFTASIADGRSVLAGYPVDETDLTCLMNEMRRAGGLEQCDQCGQWGETGALCEECATHVLTEQERHDIRAEKRAERAADFDSNWS